MKNILRNILLINFAVFSLFALADGQTTVKTERMSEWNQFKIEKSGVMTISLPPKLIEKTRNELNHQNGDLTWTDFYLNYRIPEVQSDPHSIDVSLSITTWNADFSKLTARQPELDTPEKLMDFELSANSRQIIPDGFGVNSMKYYEVGNIKGILTIATLREKQIRLVWHLLRYFEKKPQNINIAVSCSQQDLPQAIKIIDSLKLTK